MATKWGEQGDLSSTIEAMDVRSSLELLNGFSLSKHDTMENGARSLIQNGISCCVTKGSLNCPVIKKRAVAPRQTMTTNVPNEIAPYIPTRIQLLTDLANLCTLLGAVLATFAMACMWKKRYYLGMFLNVSANIADIIDGPIARSFPNRHPTFSAIGSKLDCYSDLVSHFVVPASLLMNLSDLHPFCTALATLYLCSGIIRQSYFEVTGRCNNGTCVYGVTSDYMVAIYCITMHLSPVIGFHLMVFLLSLVMIFMIFASLTFSLRSRRYDGFDLFTTTLFNIFLAISCLILAFHAAGDFAFGSGILFVMHVVLAYPSYFRFIELNS